MHKVYAICNQQELDMLYRKLFLNHVFLILAILSINACTNVYTFDFIIDEKCAPLKVEDYELKLDMFAVKDIAANSDILLTKNRYFLSFNFIIPDKKKADPIYDLQLDTVVMIQYPSQQKQILIVKSSYFLGFSSYKKLTKHFNLKLSTDDDQNPNRLSSIIVPPETDSLQFSFDALLYKGQLVKRYHAYSETSGVDKDSIIYDANIEPLQIPLEFTALRHEEISKTLKLFSPEQ